MRSNSLVMIAVAAYFLLGCKEQKPQQLTSRQHRLAFFPAFQSEELSDYQFSYRFERGAYATLARFSLVGSTKVRLPPEGFVEREYVDQPEDRTAMAELIRVSAASLFGGADGVPAWFRPTANIHYRYFVKQDAAGNWNIWVDPSQGLAYFVGSGDGDILARARPNRTE